MDGIPALSLKADSALEHPGVNPFQIPVIQNDHRIKFLTHFLYTAAIELFVFNKLMKLITQLIDPVLAIHLSLTFQG